MNSTKLTREIQLSPQVITLINSIQEELKTLQGQYKSKSEQLSTILTGICFQEELDISKGGVQLSEDYTKILVYDTVAEPAVEAAPEKENKKKK